MLLRPDRRLLVPRRRFAPLAATAFVGGVGGAFAVSSRLTNGVAFTVNGSGFGTKSGSAPSLYDGMQPSGSPIIQVDGGIWSCRRPFFGTGHSTDTWIENYRAPTDLTPTGGGDTWGNSAGNIIPAATPFRSTYICSALMSSSQGGYAAGNLQIGQIFSSLNPATTPFYMVLSWYETYSSNWVFSTPYDSAANDNNFKWIIYTTDLGPTDSNWYMEYQNSAFTSATSTPAIDINDIAGGVVGALPAGGEYIGSPAMPNKYYNGINGWVKKEVVGFMTPATSGFIKLTTSQPAGLSGGAAGGTTTGQARFLNYNCIQPNTKGPTDPYSNVGRTINLGGFRRDFPQAHNRQYWSDVYLDVQTSGLGRFALTETNSLSTATVIEYQPYTAWSSTSVTLTCQKGNLPTGSVYLWYLDEVNGNQGPFAYTMN